jgi:alpha-amylase
VSSQVNDDKLEVRMGRWRAFAVPLGCAALVAATVLPVAHYVSATPTPAAAAASSGGSKDVMANLFEWNWDSVATECTTVLGPGGYGGVQVAPPADSLKRTKLGDGSDTILHPWWEVYQPVSYALGGRMGSEAQFASMVSTCRTAGVKVYVDAVINHMTGQGSVSYGGRSYTHLDYPGLYSTANFHQKGPDCTSSTGGIDDFNNLIQVRKCELVGLADLRTETPAVRARIAGYLNKLIGYGVSGFRVDAAKHIGQPDLLAIQSLLHRTVDGTRPYFALEVFGGGPGILAPEAFTSAGSVLGLDADVQIKNAFKSYPADATGSIATLKTFGEGSGLPPSSKALTFVQNHDTERNGDALSYKDGATNVLANQFLLAYGYGTPQVYSSFAWGVPDDSPPSNAGGLITDTDCSSSAWACVDRDTGVLGLVAFHNRVGRAPVTHWWDDGQNLVSFNRGRNGFVALNNDKVSSSRTFATGLPAGVYCDLAHGKLANGACTGPTVTVAAGGTAKISVPAKGAVALTKADRVR